MASMEISSPEFEHHQSIPKKYTCQGDDVNPPLKIADIPPGAKCLVLIVDDPDAPMGPWDHWIIWNIQPVEQISENSVPMGAVEGKNSWGKNQYGGPCPPSGTHRYFFKLYALDSLLELPSDSGKADVEKAMEGHVIGESQLIGVYEKS